MDNNNNSQLPFTSQAADTSKISIFPENIVVFIISLLVVAALSSAITFFLVQSTSKNQETITPAINDLTVSVIDTVTKKPIEKAQVEVREDVVCLTAVGYPCPTGFVLKKETDTNGKVIFYQHDLRGSALYVSAQNYSSARQEFRNESPYENIIVELIGGSVKTREEALAIISRDKRISAWITSHSNVPNTSPASPEAEVIFQSPNWVVSYMDKACNMKLPSAITTECELAVTVDSQSGKIVSLIKR
ncbi:MAG: hypothetical protein M3Q44_08360 [bacterium]|nr:hypothetical protein [bacterium]